MFAIFAIKLLFLQLLRDFSVLAPKAIILDVTFKT